MIKRGVTVWNYPGSPIENAREFYNRGFNAISWLGRDFTQENEHQLADLAAFLAETGMILTVHYGLPRPEDKAKCKIFEETISWMSLWQERYGLMTGLTFDSVFEIKLTMPYLAFALNAFRNKNTFLACEDTPLDLETFEEYKRILKPEDDFGILIDTGHMNLRQTKAGKNRPEDFINAF